MLASHLSPRPAAPRRVSRRARLPRRASDGARWHGYVRVSPRRGSAARAEPLDGDADTSAKRTLSALDSLLGADAPDPFDVALEASVRGALEGDDDDERDDAIRVPLIYTSVPGKGASSSRNPIGGSSPVTGALSADDPSRAAIGSTYVAITVSLPDRATRAQRERGVKGVELDWCVDTACTTNFILPQVAYGLDVEIVGAAPAGVGATGAISSGQEMLLGTAKLGSDGDDGSGVAAITGLSAAIVQVPAPGTAGILGRSFLNCFGAVEFDWCGGASGGKAAMYMHQAYAAFDDASEEARGEAVPMRELACGLLAIDVDLNGVRVPALVDTGAPQTIVNRAAARAAGIELVGEDGDDGEDGSGSSRSTDGNRNRAGGGFKNPFAAVADAVSRGREQALGSSGAVTVMGAGGRPERLDKARRSRDVSMLVSGGGGRSETRLSSPQILVGDLEAFRVGLGLRSDSVAGAGDGQPGIVLGLDALMSVSKVAMRTTPGDAKMKFFP